MFCLCRQYVLNFSVVLSSIFYISLFAFDVFGKFTIAQDDMKTFGKKHCIKILPIRTCTLHGFSFDFVLVEPICHCK